MYYKQRMQFNIFQVHNKKYFEIVIKLSSRLASIFLLSLIVSKMIFRVLILEIDNNILLNEPQRIMTFFTILKDLLPHEA